MKRAEMTGHYPPHIGRGLEEQHLSFEPPLPTIVDGKAYENGVEYCENGDVRLTVFAPAAKRVWLNGRGKGGEMEFTPTGQGCFAYTLKYRPELSGPIVLDLYFDGNPVLYPNFPVGWLGNGLKNVIDMPSPYAARWEIRKNAHGAVSSEIYYSEVLKDFKRCVVYTPPGYAKGHRAYPVLYMLHGGGSNELEWFYSGRAAHIFDNLIEEGRIEPFIAVATNGMVRFPDSGRVIWDSALENMLIGDVIPHIERCYRTYTDKWQRAICGLSMGAYMTNDIGLRHPELFGYVGQFTACMTHYIDYPDYERPFLSVMRQMEQDPEEFGRRYRVFFRSTTQMEDHFDYFENDDAILAKAGIDKLPCHYRVVYSDKTSKWDSWRLGLYDYAQLIFK